MPATIPESVKAELRRLAGRYADACVAYEPIRLRVSRATIGAVLASAERKAMKSAWLAYCAAVDAL